MTLTTLYAYAAALPQDRAFTAREAAVLVGTDDRQARRQLATLLTLGLVEIDRDTSQHRTYIASHVLRLMHVRRLVALRGETRGAA